MSEVVGALVGLEALEGRADGVPQGADDAGGRLAQQCLELGEQQLDQVQVGGVQGQVDQFGAARLDRLADPVHLVRREFVHDHDVARPEGGR